LLPHCTVLLVGHSTCKQLVQHPVTVTVWLQLVLSPHKSVISQVWVMVITMPSEVMSTLVAGLVDDASYSLVQQDVAVGRSNIQALPHCTVLTLGHCTCKQFVQLAPSSTVTVKLHEAVLVQQSVAVQFTVVTVPGAK
jgi:hypothetical protein